jgi:hypothetical protein
MQKTRSNTKVMKKVDGLIEAAHFGPDGKLAWVRAYERRGPTWSDIVLLDRPSLIQRLKAGKRFHVGARTEFMASEFVLGEQVRVVATRRGPVLVTGKGGSSEDRLQTLPIV